MCYKLVECTVNPSTVKNVGFYMTTVTLVPSVVFIYFNLFVGISLFSIFLLSAYILLNTQKIILTDVGVYVCRRNGKVIYDYKYDEIESVDILVMSKNNAIKIVNSKYHSTKWLVAEDQTRIIVSDDLDGYSEFTRNIAEKTKDKLTTEVKKYINNR
jgi:hypothetical protein